jgi:hypothetical protein
VAAARARQPQSVPVQLLLDRACVEAERSQPLRVGGLAEDRDVARQQPLARLVEVVASADFECCGACVGASSI